MAIFKRGQETIGQKSQFDERSLITTTFDLGPSQQQQRHRVFDKDASVNRVKMLVIANSICLELIVWSATDENGNKINY